MAITCSTKVLKLMCFFLPLRSVLFPALELESWDSDDRTGPSAETLGK